MRVITGGVKGQLYCVCVLQAVDGLGCGQGEEERRGECEEAIGAIATAVVGLKRRSVSMANRHRRRWRDVARGRGTREAESSGSSSLESGERDERERNNEEGEKGEAEEPEVKVARDLGGAVGVVGKEEGVVGGGGGVVMGEEVLALLERYSQQLVHLVRQKTAQPPQ